MVRCVAALVVLAAAGAVPGQEPWQAMARFVETHCLECHDSGSQRGGLDLELQPSDGVEELWRWSRMRDRVASGEMPPPDDSEVGAAERVEFVRNVDAVLAARVPQLPVDPGQVTIRRLSRAQWRNVVQDLLGIDVATERFPADDLGYGFDSIGDALTFSTLHLEKYLAAARAVAAEVFHGEDPEHPAVRRFEAEEMRVADDRNVRQSGDLAVLLSNATLEQIVTLPRDGEYRLRIVARAQQAGTEPARMAVSVDGRRLELFDVVGDGVGEFDVAVRLAGGAHTVGLSFVNDHYDPQNPDPKQRDRNLYLDSLEVVGPVDERPVPTQQQWLHEAAAGRDDATRLRRQVQAMLSRLWRRAPTADELRRVQRAAAERLRAGEPLLEAQRFALTAALVSPHFLFRVEAPPRPGRPPEPIGAAEYATRLSFFLWASAPDEGLVSRAASLRAGDELAFEVDRMLRDPRGERLATDFAAQWLELRQLDDLTPDPARYPGFDAALRGSLRRETELLFLAVLREDRDVRELLDCDFTHIDATLARYYGIPHDGPAEAFARVTLDGGARLRGGLLGHGSVLAVTSNPTRTSPVRRGKWMLENLLGQAPPPPPPGNDSFTDEAGIDSAASLRAQMAQHRRSPKCAACHVRMDALGFALERFDAIGRRRERDEGGAIDASGELPDGRRIDGLADLKRVLVDDPAFVRTLAHKLFVYAVGRDVRPVDRLRIDLAVRQLVEAGPVRLRDLVLLVARDPAFGSRAAPARVTDR